MDTLLLFHVVVVGCLFCVGVLHLNKINLEI